MHGGKPNSDGRQVDIRKTEWSAPMVTVLQINTAEGSISGPLCDKHGSLSTGGGCP